MDQTLATGEPSTEKSPLLLNRAIDVNSVGRLIEVLGSIGDRNTLVFTTSPPFTGVCLVRQEDGSVLICSPQNGKPTPEEIVAQWLGDRSDEPTSSDSE